MIYHRCRFFLVRRRDWGEHRQGGSAAMDGGWFLKIKLSDASELDALMDENAYKEYVAGLD